MYATIAYHGTSLGRFLQVVRGTYLARAVEWVFSSFLEGGKKTGQRVFLGLRGLVLRGWAIIVEIEVEEHTPGILTLKEIGDEGKPYRKHFVDLNGLGIRDMCLHGQDMLLLAGPTMSLEGAMQVFRLRDALELAEDSMTDLDGKELEFCSIYRLL